MLHRSLPQLAIPVPCHAAWHAMTPIDREGHARFCDSCQRPVYDSGAMTRGELADLIARHEGRRLPCVRLHLRPDGTIVTRDCFAPLLRAGRFLWLKVVLGAVAFWAAAFGLRPLARALGREAAGAAATRTTEIRGGLLVVRKARDPAGLAKLPPPAVRSRAIPRLWIQPLLSDVDRAAPLRYLEAEEAIRQRLEPDRFPPLEPGPL